MTVRIREREDTRTLSGSRLGRYEVCAELASGGMATVYLARARGLGDFRKLVALKCIHPALARDRTFVEMFHDEARIASRIAHPNVCGVFDVGCEDGVHYLAMDYLHGETLASLLLATETAGLGESGRWPFFATAIVAAACEGLHVAHELRGDDGAPLDVVHRDVSPHNVFVTYDGGVRVVDFGIARAVGRVHSTMSGVVKGKAAYMSPEQILSEPMDRRTDVWALGVTLWELLTRKRLFRRQHQVDTIRAVLDGPIEPPSSLASNVPRELDAIVMCALERNPGGRWRTARAMGRALRTLVAKHCEVVGPAELSEVMERLFPEKRAEKEALVEDARSDARSDRRAERTVTMAGVVPRAPIPTPEPTTPVPTNTPADERVELPLSYTARRGWLAVAAGVGLGVVAAVAGAVGPSNAEDLAPLPSARAASDADPTIAARPSVEPARSPLHPAHVQQAETREPAPTVETDHAAAAPARARRAAAPSAPGTLVVGYRGGWAEVRIDGRHAGQTPLAIEIRAGRRVVEVFPFGGPRARRQRVRVRPGRSTHLVFGDAGDEGDGG